MKEKVNFLKGKKHGESYLTHEDYGIIKISTYEKGVLNGQVVSFYADKSLKITCTYLDGKKHGKEIFYSKAISIPTHFFTYEKGVLNGLCITYYENGFVKKSEVYKNGIRDGKYLEYDNEGNLVINAYSQKGHFISGYRIINGKKVKLKVAEKFIENEEAKRKENQDIKDDPFSSADPFKD